VGVEHLLERGMGIRDPVLGGEGDGALAVRGGKATDGVL